MRLLNFVKFKEIGISSDEARVSIIQFSQSTKTVISFADSYDDVVKAIEDDMTMDEFVAQSKGLSQK